MFSMIISTVVKIVLFLFIFGVVVISHEFGHYLLARVNGIHVVEFAIGMGPTLFAIRGKETKYSLKLFPIGGACMFEGEDGLELQEKPETDPEQEKQQTKKSGAFPDANVWGRISTVFAGPLFNFILASVVAFVFVQLVIVREPVLTIVSYGSPAMEAGLQVGDRLLKLNDRKIYLFEEISYFNAINKDKEVTVVYLRDGEKRTTTLTPRLDPKTGNYVFGVNNESPYTVKGLDTFRFAWYEVRASLINTYSSLYMLVTMQLSRNDVAGPVGVANVVGEIYEENKENVMDVLVNVMNIIILLSVNLGILNLLPLPALDGGRLVFLFVEVLRGKPVPPEKEGMVHFIGLIFFMVLTVLVFSNDIINIVTGLINK